MTDLRPKGFVAFLREAKRRKVYVSLVAYVGVTVVLLELTGPVAEALLLPDWTSRLVTFLLLLGFPVVLVLSWTFDLTGKGVVRTAEEEGGETKTDIPSSRSGSPVAAVGASGFGLSNADGRLKPKGRGAPVPLPSLRRRRPAAMETASAAADGEGNGESQAPDPDRVRRATLAHMRHELRTPINGIIGYAEMLLEDVEEEAFTGDLERIQVGGRKLLGLIDGVLGEGGSGNGDQNLESYAEQIRLGLRTPVTSVVGYAEMLLETAEEEGRGDLVPDLERIHASAHRLLELSGDIVGLATTGEAETDVEDSGPSKLTRTVLSKIGSGPGAGSGTAEGRLLVVDDNETNRDLLSRQLARQGYSVLTAENGADALELLQVQAVDLILLDVIMPIMDGVETLKRLKSDEKLQEIPVLMLSSLDEVDGALHCIEMGAEDYLSKPVQPAILDARITANLELHRMRERERAFAERSAVDEAFIDELLRGAFPEVIGDRVRAGDADLGDVAPEATVLRGQLRGFSPATTSGTLGQRLQSLKEFYRVVEELAQEHGVETCIWRNDGFVAVAGVPSTVEGHIERASGLGRALLVRIEGLLGPVGGPLKMGLGLHTGPVSAAALGGERLRYEVWGEGVRTAGGLAEVAPDGGLLVSPPAQARLNGRFSFRAQKVRDIAGVQMRTFLFDGEQR